MNRRRFCLQKNGSQEQKFAWYSSVTVWLTTIRHVARVPMTQSGYIAPESATPVVRVATVVDSGTSSTVRKPAIFVLWPWCPGLACTTVLRYWRVADVVSSVRWWIAVSNTCTVHAVHHTCNKPTPVLDRHADWQSPLMIKRLCPNQVMSAIEMDFKLYRVRQKILLPKPSRCV